MAFMFPSKISFTSCSCNNCRLILTKSYDDIIIYDDGSTYKGDFWHSATCKNNKVRHGKGSFTNSGKTITYTGNWYMDKMQGYGEYSCPEYEYKGEWRDNLRSGSGICVFANGDVYEGKFLNGEMYGRGKMTYFPDERHLVSYSGLWRGRGKTT